MSYSDFNVINLINSPKDDILRFIFHAFNSNTSKETWHNVYLIDPFEMEVSLPKPSDRGTPSSSDLLISGVAPTVYEDKPYIVVNDPTFVDESTISENCSTAEGFYKDDNEEDMKAIYVSGLGGGTLSVDVGASSIRQRNEILEWLLIYFKIGRNMFRRGSPTLEIKGGFGVYGFRIQGSNTPVNIVGERKVFTGNMTMSIEGDFNVFIPLEGIIEGKVISGNAFLQEVQVLLEEGI